MKFGEVQLGQRFTREGWMAFAIKIKPYDTTGGNFCSWVNYRMEDDGTEAWCDSSVGVWRDT